METTPWWASESLWKKTAIWVTSIMLVVLIFLTFDSVNQITAGLGFITVGHTGDSFGG